MAWALGHLCFLGPGASKAARGRGSVMRMAIIWDLEKWFGTEVGKVGQRGMTETFCDTEDFMLGLRHPLLRFEEEIR